MSRRKPEVPQVSPVKKEKGKIKIYSLGVSVGKAFDSENSKVKIVNDRRSISKESAQINEDSSSMYSLNYKIPHVSRELCKLFYEQNVYVFRACELKAALVAGLGTQVLPDDENLENYTEDEEYIRFKNFLSGEVNANMETFEDVSVAACTDYNLFKDAYIETFQPKDNELELYNLRAYNTRVSYDARVPRYIDAISIVQLLQQAAAKKFKLFGSTNKEKYNEVLWVKGFNPFNKFYGFPETYPASGDISLDRSAIEYNVRSFTNDLMVNFVIKVEGGELDDGALNEIQNFLEKNYKGVANANRALYINSDDPNVKISIDKLNKDVKDGSFEKMRNISRDNTVISTGVPAILLGISTPGKLGGSNEFEAIFRLFNQTEIQPQKRKWASRYNLLFRKKLGITKFHMEFVEMTYENFADTIKYADLCAEKPLDVTEVREYLGYGPKKETGNKVLKELKELRSKIQKMSESA